MNNCTNRRYCGTLREENIGEKVTVYGWVGRNRNLGSLIFTDMRDRTGIVQCVFDQAVDADLALRAEDMRMEWVVAIEGTVRMRSSINPTSQQVRSRSLLKTSQFSQRLKHLHLR